MHVAIGNAGRKPLFIWSQGGYWSSETNYYKLAWRDAARRAGVSIAIFRPHARSYDIVI